MNINDEEQSQTVNEPVAAYGAVGCNAEEYLRSIPQETMQGLVCSAVDDYMNGRCTSHSQMNDWIYERMGWDSAPQEITHLPDEILIAAIKYADIAEKEGRMIPNKDVYHRLAQRLGWE